MNVSRSENPTTTLVFESSLSIYKYIIYMYIMHFIPWDLIYRPQQKFQQERCTEIENYKTAAKMGKSYPVVFGFLKAEMIRKINLNPGVQYRKLFLCLFP